MFISQHSKSHFPRNSAKCVICNNTRHIERGRREEIIIRRGSGGGRKVMRSTARPVTWLRTLFAPPRGFRVKYWRWATELTSISHGCRSVDAFQSHALFPSPPQFLTRHGKQATLLSSRNDRNFLRVGLNLGHWVAWTPPPSEFKQPQTKLFGLSLIYPCLLIK